jgi:hypothetical protein
MKRTLLLVAVTAFVFVVNAQKKITAYAITGAQKGQSGWNEVRLIDITTGEEVQSVYKSDKNVELLNARTGKPIVKKDIADNTQLIKVRELNNVQSLTKLRQLGALQETNQLPQANAVPRSNVDNLAIAPTVNTNVNTNLSVNTTTNTNLTANGNSVVVRTGRRISTDKPFATSSAAMAYDQKHERLYYTPMNIAQLRYIDLKTNRIYYFEDDAFGVVQGRGDVQNQITRMVIASDGNGYAITNDANHLIQFTTGKKPVITDLGPLTDDPSNGSHSVHGSGHFGGDVIADVNKNLFLIGADRTVYKINLDSKLASYIGSIKGLPNGFSTNGAVAEGGSTVIVTSSTSTIGYYRFDLNTLQAEKVSTGGTVFNASDLANGTLAFEKTKKKKERKIEPLTPVAIVNEPAKDEPAKSGPAKTETKATTLSQFASGSLSVYPNPVRTGLFKMSFADQLPGEYQIQLVDISGRVVSTKQVSITNKLQTEEFRLPNQMASGNYLVKVIGEGNKVSNVTKIVIE